MLSIQPLRVASIAWRIIDGEAILVNPDSGLVYPLNPVATRAWELFDGEHTLEAIVAILLDEFDAPYEVIRKDVEAFVEECTERGLV